MKRTAKKEALIIQELKMQGIKPTSENVKLILDGANGFDFNLLNSQETNQNDGNCIEIYFWYIRKTKNNWDYLSNTAILYKLEEEKNDKKRIANYCEAFAFKCLKNINAPLTGYNVEKLPNNKPLTLLEYQSKKDFVCFIDGKCLHSFKLNDNKKVVEPVARFGSCMWANEDSRKNPANGLFAIYNPLIVQVLEARKKHFERQQKNNTFDPMKRYHSYRLLPYSVRANSKDPFDRNGYFLAWYRQQLQDKAKPIIQANKQKKKDNLRAEWIASNHEQQAIKVNAYLKVLKDLIISFSSFDKIIVKNNLDILEQLTDLYRRFEKQTHFENYQDINEWSEYLTKKEKEYFFYLTAIKRKVFNKLACFHQYEKTPTGYKMKASEGSYWRNIERYVQEF